MIFTSLRSRLVAAFAAVIFLALFLAGSGAVVLLREYQTEREIARLSDLAVPLSTQVRFLQVAGSTPEEVNAFLERQAGDIGARIVLIDRSGRVVSDTADALVGQQLALPAGVWSAAPGKMHVTAFQVPDGDAILIATRSAGPVPIPRSFPRSDRAPGVERPWTAERAIPAGADQIVALVVPQQDLVAAWLELAPRLALAGAVSLIVSVAVAIVLSNSIARPLAQITRASEAMARGDYEQSIPVRGRDEVGRLAAAFNEMARQVARSHRAMRDFLANVSHDLRTPLTSIQGFSQALIDGTIRTPGDQVEAGRIIHEEAERMRRLVEELLVLSRLESGQLQLERRELDAVELARGALRRFEPRAAELGLALALEADRQRPAPVLGDPHRLAQVLDNLLDNALRHTPPGGRIALRVQTPARPAGHPEGTDGRAAGAGHDRPGGVGPGSGMGNVALAVHNTGSYIPPAEQERVFERFYQVERSRSGGGAGLGLAIAREIVLAHGGTITLASTPDDGTTFTVLLPALARPAGALASSGRA